MRDHDHGHAVAREILHYVEHLANHFRVERAGRLVEQHHIRVHGQRAHDGDALLLPAGKRRRIRVCLFGQAHALEQFHGALVRLLLGHHFQMDGRERDVFQHGLVREQVELLKHHAHTLADVVDVHTPLHDVRALKDHLAGRGHFQQVEAAQKRGFARTAGADHHELFPLGDVLVHAAQHVIVAKKLVQILNVNHWRAPSSQSG